MKAGDRILIMFELVAHITPDEWVHSLRHIPFYSQDYPRWKIMPVCGKGNDMELGGEEFYIAHKYIPEDSTPEPRLITFPNFRRQIREWNHARKLGNVCEVTHQIIMT